MNKPYYTLGLSSVMGPKLRELVENQLLEDLKYYDYKSTRLKFDWSDSCIEGSESKYLDGTVENFSGIALYDNENNLVAEGWMEFIHSEPHFIAYWDHLIFKNGHMKEKVEFGIPKHIKEFIKINNIPDSDYLNL